LQDNSPPGLDESERNEWWKIVTKCWGHDPHNRPSMDDVSLKLLQLNKTIHERITGISPHLHSIRVTFSHNNKQDFVAKLTKQENMTSSSVIVLPLREESFQPIKSFFTTHFYSI
jgi:hypothetical protein